MSQVYLGVHHMILETPWKCLVQVHLRVVHKNERKVTFEAIIAIFLKNFDFRGQWRSQKLSFVPISIGKGLGSSFCQENGVICHIFFNLPCGGHRGQTIFPYDLHHDAPFRKA